jgi:hypothetical protein
MILADAEDVAKSWLMTTSVAPLVNGKIFLAMPKGSPNPCVLLSRVGGAPPASSTTNEDVARISFTIYAPSRPAAKQIATALATELSSIYEGNPISTPSGVLDVGEIISWLWSPDPKSDTPRYIIDANFIVRSN